MASLNDPRDILPPFLRRYCPSQEQCRAWSTKCRAAIYDAWQHWLRLERPWKLWSICVLFAVVFLPFLFVTGDQRPSRPVMTPDRGKVSANVSSQQATDENPLPQATVEGDKEHSKLVHVDVPPPVPTSLPQVATDDKPSTTTAHAPAKHRKKRTKPHSSDATKEILQPSPPELASKPDGQESREPIASVALSREYYANALAADAKYKNGVVIFGYVRGIGREPDGRYYARFDDVVCYVDKDAEKDFADVQPFVSDEIRVRAKAVGIRPHPDKTTSGYLLELKDGRRVK